MEGIVSTSTWRQLPPLPTIAAAVVAIITVGLVVGLIGGLTAPRSRADPAPVRRAANSAGALDRARNGGGAGARNGAAGASRPPASRPNGPEQVAAAFTAALLTFRWDDPPDAVRQRCRPWDTDQVDAALAGPGVPAERDRRAASHEIDSVSIHAVNPQDRAFDHLDASVAGIVTRQLPGRPSEETTEFVDLQVTATGAGWAVDQVSQ